MTALLIPLIEAELAQAFKDTKVPLSRYLTLEKAAKLLQIPIVEFHDYIKESKSVHAVVWEDQFLIHPNTLLKYVRRRIKSKVKKDADPELLSQLLQKKTP